MKKPVIVREEAEADLAEAYQWYEQQVSGLGILQNSKKKYRVFYTGQNSVSFRPGVRGGGWGFMIFLNCS